MEPEALRPDTLAAIRTLGGRRRRARTTVAVAGAAAGVAFASVGLVAALGGDGPQASDVDATGRPSWSSTTLSPLTRRVLTEIPGAVQVSDTQVVIPEPPGATNELAGMEVEDDRVDGARVDVGAHSYRGVTSFAPGAFPAWLYDKVAEYERGSTTSPARSPRACSSTPVPCSSPACGRRAPLTERDGAVDRLHPHAARARQRHVDDRLDDGDRRFPAAGAGAAGLLGRHLRERGEGHRLDRRHLRHGRGVGRPRRRGRQHRRRHGRVGHGQSRATRCSGRTSTERPPRWSPATPRVRCSRSTSRSRARTWVSSTATVR